MNTPPDEYSIVNRSLAQRFRRSLERIAKEHGRSYQEAKDVAIRYLKKKARTTEAPQ